MPSSSPLCAAIKPDGSRCKARATRGSSWCYSHDPDRSEERRRNASRGGKSGGNGRPGPGRNLQVIDETLEAMVLGILQGKVERGDAAVVIQACNSRIRVAEQERRTLEYEEITNELEKLRELVEEGRERGDIA